MQGHLSSLLVWLKVGSGGSCIHLLLSITQAALEPTLDMVPQVSSKVFLVVPGKKDYRHRRLLHHPCTAHVSPTIVVGYEVPTALHAVVALNVFRRQHLSPVVQLTRSELQHVVHWAGVGWSFPLPVLTLSLARDLLSGCRKFLLFRDVGFVGEILEEKAVPELLQAIFMPLPTNYLTDRFPTPDHF